jgi:ribonuclease BN (tRNA processing enzyme)
MSYSRREFIRYSSLALGSTSIDFPFASKLSILGNQNGNRLVLLGTKGGPFISSYIPSPSANVILYRSIPYIIDTGYGVTFKLIEAGINLSSLNYIFITHHHSDHNLELGPLLYNAWIAGLSTVVNIYAPPGLNALLDSYWKSNRIDIETRIKDEARPDIRKMIKAHEYKEGIILTNPDSVVTALRNIHPPMKESYALKFKFGDKIIVFSGDTTYFPALAEFASGADYLVHEVMYGPAVEALAKRRPNATGLKESILSHHTLAEDVGRIASQAKVKTLVLNHFVPGDDKSLTDQVWIDAVRTNFSGKIIVGKDLLSIPF